MCENKKVCMFTGHRMISPDIMKSLVKKVDEIVEQLIVEGYTEFRAGGAIGFDTIAALKVLEKREKYGFIRLVLYLPCYGQESKWDRGCKEAYEYVLSGADERLYSEEKYTPWCMQKRNREMVEGSDLCIAYCNSTSGGSHYTVQYANQKQVKVRNLFEEMEKGL